MKNKSEKQKQDHFLKLPDEIIISIFTKLSKTHFKFLCQSVSLVSKRFAFLLHRIPTISVSLPLKWPLPSQFIDFVVLALPKFVQIHSINIVVEYCSDFVLNQDPNFLKWRANYTTKSQTFVFLSSASIHSKKEYQGEEVDNEIQMPTTYMKKSRDLSAYNCSVTACLWFEHMGLVINRGLPMLRSVKVTDSNKQGMLCFRDEELPEMRNGLMVKSNNKIWEELKGGYLPVSHLPLSGLVMEGVIIAMFSVGDDDNGDYDDLLNWDFEDCEELFVEAVTTIFRNNKNRLFRFDVPRNVLFS